MQFDFSSSLISTGALAALMGLWMLLTSFADEEQNPVQLRIWGASSILFGIAFCLFAARGTIPLFWSFVLGNTLFGLGYSGFGWAISLVFRRRFPFQLVGWSVGACVVLLFVTEIVLETTAWRVPVLVALTIVPWSVAYLQCTWEWRANPVPHILAMRVFFAAIILVSFSRLTFAALQGSLGYEGLPTGPGYLVGSYILLMSPVLLTVGFFLLCAEQAQETIKELANTDPLTGILNRRSVLEMAESRLASARRRHQPFSVVTLDLDRFKAVNDAHGHAAGDLVLRRISELMASCKRTEDALGRLGGDEFVVFMPYADVHGAIALAERMRRAIAAETVVWAQHELNVTASFGVASRIVEDTSPQDMLQRADRAMYVAKNAGGNAVHCHDDEPMFVSDL